MHPFFVLSLAVLTCSAAILLAHATKPFLLSFDGLAVDSLLRRAVPATFGLLGRFSRRCSVSDLTSKILRWTNLGSSPTCNTTSSSNEQPSQDEPPPAQDVRPETPRYEWLWLKTKRVFVKAFLNVLRRQVRTVSLPSWALGLSVRCTRANPSGLTTVIFAAGVPHPHSPTTTLTVSRGLWWLGYSSYPYPA